MHVIPFDGSPNGRNELRTRLRTAGCPVKEAGQDWLTAGDFSLQAICEFKLNPENSTVGTTTVHSASVEGNADLEAMRQLVYARAIEILTKLHGEFFQGSHGLPGYLWSGEYGDWLRINRQLNRTL